MLKSPIPADWIHILQSPPMWNNNRQGNKATAASTKGKYLFLLAYTLKKLLDYNLCSYKWEHKQSTEDRPPQVRLTHHYL